MMHFSKREMAEHFEQLMNARFALKLTEWEEAYLFDIEHKVFDELTAGQRNKVSQIWIARKDSAD